MRAALIVSVLLATATGLAHGQTSPVPPAGKAPAATAPDATAAKSRRAKAEKEPSPAATTTESLESCLRMWEASTHMSRQEWARACRRVDARLRNLTVK